MSADLNDQPALVSPSSLTPQGVCQHCGQRPATMLWATSAMDFAHGFEQHWCEICVVSEQLKFARERAAEIPRLEAQLAQALADDQSSSSS